MQAARRALRVTGARISRVMRSALTGMYVAMPARSTPVGVGRSALARRDAIIGHA